MTKTETFDAVVLRKVPYLKRILPALLVLLILFVMIGTAVVFPEHNPGSRFPDSFKMALLFGGFALIPVWILFAYVRLKKQVTLSFGAETITLTGNNYQKVLPVNTLRKVECYDPQTEAGVPEEEFTIVFCLYNNKKTIVRLQNYADAEKVTDLLSVYENVSAQVLTYKKTILV